MVSSYIINMEQRKNAHRFTEEIKISSEILQTKVVKKKSLEKCKAVDDLNLGIKRSKSRISNGPEKIHNKSNSKPSVLSKEECRLSLTNVKDKNIINKHKKSTEKLSNNTSQKPKKSQTVNLNSSKQILNKSQKNKSFEENIPKEKVKKTTLSKNISKISEDDISFDDIEKRIFEGISKKSKKVKIKTENLNDTSSDVKKTSTQNVSRFNQKNSNKTCIKQSEKVSRSKDKKMDKHKIVISNEDKKLVKHDKIVANSKNKKISTIKDESKLKSRKNKKIKNEESSSDEGDWEDVDELSELLKNKDHSKPTKDIQIELEAENILWGIKKRRRRTYQEQVEDYLRKEINRNIKEVHENMHKTHLLCLLAHGMYVNSLLSSETLLSCALSIIPQLYYSPKRFDISHLEKFVNWFHSHFKIRSSHYQEEQNVALESVEDNLIARFETRTPTSIKDLVLMFVATSRTIGMAARYVQNLAPLTWKPSSSTLLKPQKYDDETGKKKSSRENILEKNTENKKAGKMLPTSSETEVKNKIDKQNGKRAKLNNSDDEYNSNSGGDDDDDDDEENFKSPLKYNKKRASTFKGKGNTAKRRKSDDKQEGNKKQKKEVFQYWAEVYVEEEEKWVSVDVTTNKIHCASEIEARTLNLAYVIAFNTNQTVKDVTKRYLSSWLSYRDKVRCDNSWWVESLKPFRGVPDRKERKEDKEMEENLKMQPLPKAINEYKNHSLYALQRHLLKFEAIYPPDASPVGFIRGEPVFPRDCVKNVYGRENWLKEAKTVRVDEEPYKIVKARPKWDRSTCQILKDRPLELFGEWQVEDYDPPTAKNGRVPRNEYGNVDLFKPCMLPKGCVHMRVNGLSRIARKIDLDCAPAVTGFDFHSGACHAIHDGFIVCQEYEDILMDAWHQDRMEQVKKEEEKRVKRIYDNWKRLINGITLKDRLKERYGVSGQEISSQVGASCGKVKETRRKIKQEDLNALPSSTITHSVVNLKIDLGSSVTDRMKKTKPKKSSINRGKAKSKSTKEFEKISDHLSSHSSDSEDLSDGERKKKIRSILDWNPTTNEGGSDPGLSDNDSDDEKRTRNSHLRNSSLMLTPISGSSSASNKSNKFSINNAKIKRKLDGPDKISSDSEPEGENIIIPTDASRKRRSLRNKIVKQINYKDNDDGSPSDISVGDSDTDDATYCPIVE